MKVGDRVRIVCDPVGRKRPRELGTITGTSRGGLIGVAIDPDTAADDSPWYPLEQTLYRHQLEVVSERDPGAGPDGA